MILTHVCLHNPFVSAVVQSPIDYGFNQVHQFDRGSVSVREGTDDLDLTALQQPLTSSAAICSAVGVVLCSATIVGIPYVLSKLTLVRRGEVGLVEAVNGNIRVLGAGWYVQFNSQVNAPVSLRTIVVYEANEHAASHSHRLRKCGMHRRC